MHTTKHDPECADSHRGLPLQQIGWAINSPCHSTPRLSAPEKQNKQKKKSERKNKQEK